MTAIEQRVREWLADRPREQFWRDIRVLYERERATNPVNPANSLSERLGANMGTLHMWLAKTSPTNRQFAFSGTCGYFYDHGSDVQWCERDDAHEH